MNTLEKIEWLDKNIEKVRAIFSESVIEGVRQGLWDIFNEEEKENVSMKQASMTDEEETFIHNAFINSNPLK